MPQTIPVFGWPKAFFKELKGLKFNSEINP
ncbi:hypothetical protein EV142_10499 [Flavobacterium circumlabens]|uniref:Uncharacterized protein n=1 Tax=Flavobacterium circumlabens TaxID=2133765 RepID=A0ABY2B0I3_9FLAO|nr:hypothetical protein EV142_10499 [Flavobacterium circumlabens]